MNTYSNISRELKDYFSNHGIFRILLPLDRVFLFGGLGLLVLNYFVSIGSLLSALAYYGFLLGLLLVYANYKQKDLYIGMFIYSATKLYSFLKNAIFTKYRYVNYSAFLACLIFAGLGYLVYKRDSSN